MIAGMRFGICGSHHHYGIQADLTTFGKAISNGYSCSVLAGKRKIMELGGIHHNRERVFLLSQTHGSETVGLAATLATMKVCERLDVSSHVWKLGKLLKQRITNVIKICGLEDHIKVIGFDANPQIICTSKEQEFWPELNTLFHQFMINQGILIQWISITLSHELKHLDETVEAIENTAKALKPIILENRVNDYLIGEAAKPVFRKWN